MQCNSLLRDGYDITQYALACHWRQAFEAAVIAYTAVLKSSVAESTPLSELVALHGNRAAALVAMQRYDSALEDCTQALTHLTGGSNVSDIAKTT